MNLFLVSLDKKEKYVALTTTTTKMKEFFTLQSKLKKAGSWLDAVFSKICCIRAISIGKNMGNQFSMHKKHYIC